jgi:pseudaminic acid cytidylyltransferase
MNICLIPARGGSKRLKNKNIINFFGKPIISYTIEKAIKSNLFDKVIVTTDSKKIASISKKYGAEVPFLRPKKYSNDFASDLMVLKHFLNHSKKNNLLIDTLCYLYPINPLLKISTLKQCKKLLLKHNSHKIMTVSKFTHPIQRALKKGKQGFFEPINVKNHSKRSQDLIECYQDAAQCYWYNIKENLDFDKIKKSKTLAVELKQFEFYDIDSNEDYKNLKKIYKNKLNKS